MPPDLLGRLPSHGPRVLALDLEGTLISTAVSQFPRPGLFQFLERCHVLFERIVIFTSVTEDRVRQIARTLVNEGTAPAWFQHLEYVHWEGATKDLAFIPNCAVSEALLVDDLAAYVHRAQWEQWVRIEPFEPPFSDSDIGLATVLDELEQRVRLSQQEGQVQVPEGFDRQRDDGGLQEFERSAPGGSPPQEDECAFVARGLRSLQSAQRTGDYVEADEVLMNLERKLAKARRRKSAKDS